MFGKLLDYLLSLILLATLLLLIVYGFKQFQEKYPVTCLKLIGKLEYIDNKKLEVLLKDILENNLWAIQVDQVKNRIYSNPWVDSVFIEKSWPNVLKVKISEQNPLAKLNDEFFISSSGKILSSTNENSIRLKSLNLPKFYGKLVQKDLMIHAYLILLEKLSPLGMYVIKLNINEEEGLKVLLNNNVTLKLGTFDLSSRISRFIFGYTKKFKTVIGDIDYIDLRYSNGIAVYWRNHDNISAKNFKVNEDLNF